MGSRKIRETNVATAEKRGEQRSPERQGVAGFVLRLESDKKSGAWTLRDRKEENVKRHIGLLGYTKAEHSCKSKSEE